MLAEKNPGGIKIRSMRFLSNLDQAVRQLHIDYINYRAEAQKKGYGLYCGESFGEYLRQTGPWKSSYLYECPIDENTHPRLVKKQTLVERATIIGIDIKI